MVPLGPPPCVEGDSFIELRAKLCERCGRFSLGESSSARRQKSFSTLLSGVARPARRPASRLGRAPQTATSTEPARCRTAATAPKWSASERHRKLIYRFNVTGDSICRRWVGRLGSRHGSCWSENKKRLGGGWPARLRRRSGSVWAELEPEPATLKASSAAVDLLDCGRY